MCNSSVEDDHSRLLEQDLAEDPTADEHARIARDVCQNGKRRRRRQMAKKAGRRGHRPKIQGRRPDLDERFVIVEFERDSTHSAHKAYHDLVRWRRWREAKEQKRHKIEAFGRRITASAHPGLSNEKLALAESIMECIAVYGFWH